MAHRVGHILQAHTRALSRDTALSAITASRVAQAGRYASASALIRSRVVFIVAALCRARSRVPVM